MIYVRDKIKEIVESIKSTGTVDSFVDNLDGTYTIGTSDLGNLQSGFKIVLVYTDTSLNIDVRISSMTISSFTFSHLLEQTAITEPDSWEMALYFEVGHRKDVNEIYTGYKKDSINRLVRYPLFWLYTDFEKTPGNGGYIAFETSLRCALVDFSKRAIHEDERIDTIFKPVLFKYRGLIETAFNTSPYKRNFVTPYGEDSTIKFSDTDRPFFGSADKEKDVMPYVTDAIEFEINLKWFIQESVCIN